MTDYRTYIGFRNRVAHGDDKEIDLAKPWDAIFVSIPSLRREAEAIYAEAEE